MVYMIINKNLFSLIYLCIGGMALGLLLIFIFEIINFSHTNLLPFGGSSWALWIQPIAVGISFALFAKLLKIRKILYIFLTALFISFFIFYFIYNGLLFMNPIPFGIGLK